MTEVGATPLGAAAPLTRNQKKKQRQRRSKAFKHLLSTQVLLQLPCIR